MPMGTERMLFTRCAFVRLLVTNRHGCNGDVPGAFLLACIGAQQHQHSAAPSA